MTKKALLVCDLDNTLYDWVSYFVPSFYAMVDAAVQVTGCDREVLLDDFRSVHQKHHDSEQPYALLETETIKRLVARSSFSEVLKELDPAFHAFNSSRKKNLRLNPGVCETLDELFQLGVVLIAHTESKLYGAVDRLSRLDLFRYFSKVYCRERTVAPNPDLPDDREWLSRFPMEKVIELSHRQVKPSPDVLLEICQKENVPTGDVAYVGDSMARDILMAKRAGVFSIWAEYGARHDASTYEALVRVSHWTKADVEREKKFSEEAKSIQPDWIARNSFCEVLDALGLPPLLHKAVLH